jgi:hypothetical protein
MKNYLLFILFVSSNLIAQKNGYRPDENDSLYIKSIKEYIKQSELHKKRFVKPNKDDTNLYVVWNSQFSDLPKNIDNYNIILVSQVNRDKIYKENKKRLVVLEITTLTFENGKFYINVQETETKMVSKNKVEWKQLGMWTTSHFNFVNGKMVLEKTELSGLYFPSTKDK